MTTKELIEILQKEDSSGELHVRIGGGTPFFAETKKGYWDGPYMYKEGNKMVLSKEGHKVDLHYTDMEDFIYENNGDISLIEFRGFSNQEDIDRHKKNFEKISNDYKRINKQSIKDFTFDIVKKLTQGYGIVEYKEKVNWGPPFVFIKDGKEEKMCLGERDAVLESGLFEIATEDILYKYWRLKNGL